MLFAWDIGVRDVIFKSDSKLVMTPLLWLFFNPLPLPTSSQQFATSRKTSDQLKCLMLGNKLAHILAQHAKCLHIFLTWIEENLILIESVRCIVFTLFLIKLLYFPLKKKKKN